LRVTDEYGRRISFGRAVGRYYAKIISVLVFGLGFLMSAGRGGSRACTT